jgi:hypothetical protein
LLLAPANTFLAALAEELPLIAFLICGPPPLGAVNREDVGKFGVDLIFAIFFNF